MYTSELNTVVKMIQMVSYGLMSTATEEIVTLEALRSEVQFMAHSVLVHWQIAENIVSSTGQPQRDR